MVRGFLGRCPNCREGAIFYRYLKVCPSCASCGHNLGRYPADDGPAYFTILITGHLVVIPVLLTGLWKASPALVVPGVLVSLAAFTLWFLPKIKGAVIGLHYALGVTREDAALHTADRFD